MLATRKLLDDLLLTLHRLELLERVTEIANMRERSSNTMVIG